MFCNESARKGMEVVRVDSSSVVAQNKGALVRWDEMNWHSEQICSHGGR